MASKGKGRGKNGSKRKAQEAPKLPAPTRRLSDTVLARLLDDHMQDSLGEISALKLRLASALGAGVFNYDQKPKGTGTGLSKIEAATDAMQGIVRWEQACKKRGYIFKTVDLAVEGINLGAIAKQLRLSRECVRLHMRSALALWSMFRQRCNGEEVNSKHAELLSCCRLKRR